MNVLEASRSDVVSRWAVTTRRLRPRPRSRRQRASARQRSRTRRRDGARSWPAEPRSRAAIVMLFELARRTANRESITILLLLLEQREQPVLHPGHGKASVEPDLGQGAVCAQPLVSAGGRRSQPSLLSGQCIFAMSSQYWGRLEAHSSTTAPSAAGRQCPRTAPG